MNNYYINIYNNLVNFSRNKDIYSLFTKKDLGFQNNIKCFLNKKNKIPY